VRALRAQRHRPAIARVSVVAADPLNFSGVLTPEKRVAANTRQQIEVFPAAG
jgi:hypothetical protein